jgi:hypothetical protein
MVENREACMASGAATGRLLMSCCHDVVAPLVLTLPSLLLLLLLPCAGDVV